MEVLQIIGGGVLMLVSIIIIIMTMMQESKQPGTNALSGQVSDSYLSKNKSKTLEAKLVLITKISLVIFFVLAIGVNLAITYLK